VAAKLDRFADAYLVERAKEGDRMALRVLCLRHFDDAYRYAIIRGQPDEAESVVREAFLIVVDEIRREKLFEPFGVRLYAALQELAGTSGRTTEAGLNGSRRRLDEFSDSALAALITGLERDQQEAVLLAHLLHLKPNEVATAMRRTQAAVAELESEAIGRDSGRTAPRLRPAAQRRSVTLWAGRRGPAGGRKRTIRRRSSALGSRPSEARRELRKSIARS
jgi:DNA-directed RNA polymerase specialized sigma24 family protein